MALNAASSPSTILRYIPPEWASTFFRNIPPHRLNMANLPTPLYRIQQQRRQQDHNPNIDKNDDNIDAPSTQNRIMDRLNELNITLLIKRDDMSAGVELGGNKIRKLEFLLADALQNDHDSVVTIGGEQSNHCRATATACRMVGLEPHLILRTKRANKVQQDKKGESNTDSFGYVGNILFDRMVGANIYSCTPGEYGRFGSKELVKQLCNELESKSNAKVYPIPVGKKCVPFDSFIGVFSSWFINNLKIILICLTLSLCSTLHKMHQGGSNGLGTWGYIEGVDEIMTQLNGQSIDHVVFACGSGGTAAGISLGFALSHIFQNNEQNIPKIHAVGVCDTPEYFYNEVANIANEMGLTFPSSFSSRSSTLEFVQRILNPLQGKGLGYAASTKEELEFIAKFAMETGIVLDPVYSGKALYHFVMHELVEQPNLYKDSTVLFWHTGGSLGLFDKVDGSSVLSPMLEQSSPVTRLDVYGTKK